MKIRSITIFAPTSWPINEGSIASAGRFLADARQRLQKQGFEVQTVRLATPPFLDIIGDPDVNVLLDFATKLEELAVKYQIDFVSIGPVVATTPLALLMSIHALPTLISQTERIFSGVLLADNKSGINMAAARSFAHAVLQVGTNSPQGLGNLRLAAMANVPAGVPYFPAAYHHGGQQSFAIATEAADLILNTITNTRSLGQIRTTFINAIEGASFNILEAVDQLVDDHQMRFSGLDFSLAPYPDQATSIAAAMEQLGLMKFGSHGTLFATAFLTSCIQQAEFPRTGFCGVMLPVLEDLTLAQRVREGTYGVNDLLLYSAVCGTGLDTVPIPGDTTPDQISALFLDMAALAVSLNKPLTARLMPIPGAAAGDPVDIPFDYFAPSHVLPLKQTTLSGLIEKSTFLNLSG